MTYSVQQIAKAVGATAEGDIELMVSGVAEPASAKQGEMALAMDPRYALSGVTRMLDKGQGFKPGIHPTAVIDSDAVIGDDVSVGPLAVISAGARIGGLWASRRQSCPTVRAMRFPV